MKRNNVIIIVLLITLSAIISVNQEQSPNLTEQSTETDTEVIYSDSFLPSSHKGISIREIPENITAIIEQGAYPSFILELTIEKVIEESDLVALVEITSKGVSFGKYPEHPIAIYNATVLNIFKGPTGTDKVHLVILEGYLKEDRFVRLEFEPELKIGDKWVMFMNSKNYEKGLDMYLLNETYRPRRLTSAKVDSNKLSLICEDIIPKLGIDGLSLEEFIQRYGSNN